MIRASLIDDHKLFRVCLKDYLVRHSGIDAVVEEDEDPELVFQSMKRNNTEVVVLDYFMGHTTGDIFIRKIKKELPKVKIVVLSMCSDLARISMLIDLGIHSFISKSDDPEYLVKAIYAAREDKIYKTKLFTEALLLNPGTREHFPNAKPVEFTNRDLKIIQLLWDEKSNKDIAAELFLGLRSIEKIRQDLKERVGVKTTLGLIKYALRFGLIKDKKTVVAEAETSDRFPYLSPKFL